MSTPEVDTKYGRVRGRVQKNIDGVDYFAFKGIPYAKPPVGQLRFKDPVEAESWSGTRDALEFGPMCAQTEPFTNTFEGSDDCLYINVYTKNLDPNARLPVMVWIHGGGFLFGSANDTYYGADLLMKKDVVLVSLNYRLGIWGFLNLNHEVATGNQGLKDQVFGLKWVQKNIAKFGGNPENVTIFGESAGGASVHFLTMSPLAKGLFHKAIAQSGVATCPWAYTCGDQVKTTAKICEILGKKVTDPVEMVKFLQTVDPAKVIEAQESVKLQEEYCYNLYSPQVDDKSPKPFLPISKEIASKEGAHVPFMIGHNNREGSLILKLVGHKKDSVDDADLKQYLHPQTFKVLESYNLSLDELKRLYCKDGKISEDLEGSINLVGDVLFIRDIHNVIKTQVERNAGPTYVYQFTYDNGYNVTKSLFQFDLSGASHMDELPYLFTMKFLDSLNVEKPKKGTPIYHKMEQMLELWTNFAKTGTPTPTTSELVPLYWQPANDGTVFRYLDIGEELQMRKMLSLEERWSYKKNSSPNA